MDIEKMSYTEIKEYLDKKKNYFVGEIYDFEVDGISLYFYDRTYCSKKLLDITLDSIKSITALENAIKRWKQINLR